jgi:copper homeostasis protein CutC
MVHYHFPYRYGGIYMHSNYIERIQLKGLITAMKFKNVFTSASIAAALSGCSLIIQLLRYCNNPIKRHEIMLAGAGV